MQLNPDFHFRKEHVSWHSVVRIKGNSSQRKNLKKWYPCVLQHSANYTQLKRCAVIEKELELHTLSVPSNFKSTDLIQNTLHSDWHTNTMTTYWHANTLHSDLLIAVLTQSTLDLQIGTLMLHIALQIGAFTQTFLL